MTHSYPPLLGGLQTATAQLAKHLAASGHDVVVVTSRYPRSLSSFERIDEVPVYRMLFLSPSLRDVVRGRIDLFLASSVLAPLHAMRLERLMRDFEPEVVNLHFPLSMIPFVMRIRRKFDFRLVVSLHGDEIERWLQPGSPSNGLRSDLSRLLRQSDAVTACSRYLLERACLLEPDVAAKGTAIHNGVHPGGLDHRTRPDDRGRYLLAYGRLTRKKGFDLLLEAFAKVSRDFPEVDLILAGDGEERAALQSLAGHLGIAHRLVFFGRASTAQVMELVQGSDFVVVPSRSEPFGIVALEALAAGAPVLATNVGGLPEILANDEARLETEVPERDGLSKTPRSAILSSRRPANPAQPPVADPFLLVEPTVDELESGLRGWLERPPSGLDEASRHALIERRSWASVTARYERVLTSLDER